MQKWTLILAVAAALCAGCSRPGQSANNKANTPANKPAAPKKSYQTEYTQEMNAAFAAWDRYGKSKSNEDYIETGVRLYTGMKYKVLQDKENGNVSGFPKVTEFGVLFMDWKKTSGPSDDARIKAARDAWSEAAK